MQSIILLPQGEGHSSSQRRGRNDEAKAKTIRKAHSPDTSLWVLNNLTAQTMVSSF
ncbi:Hypothetical protein CINCED_3A000004 [Cinara cedri]|uniref:Uncharacterized protein n=1 Tax=Cinara cedri TaxID=506608 RepID=A0A5E4MJ50_9HEMI|nr:Hypothetical protein CINCED_3A000004 [Cinara cedri]